jgi:hypothetical protein
MPDRRSTITKEITLMSEQTIFCPECGTQNLATSSTCTNCGKSIKTLEVAKPGTAAPVPPKEVYGVELWWNRRDPALRAYLTVLAVLVTLSAFEFLPMGGLVTIPISVLVAATQGYLVVKYARAQTGYVDADYRRLAIKSAVIGMIVNSIMRILATLLRYGLSAGVMVIALPLDIFNTVIGGIVPMIVTIIAAELAKRNQMRTVLLTFTLVAVGMCCVLAVAAAVGGSLVIGAVTGK